MIELITDMITESPKIICLFNVNFWIFDRNYSHNYNQNSRIINFLSVIGLGNRYISRFANILLNELIDFTIANDYLFNMRCKSIEFLYESIDLTI